MEDRGGVARVGFGFFGGHDEELASEAVFVRVQAGGSATGFGAGTG